MKLSILIATMPHRQKMFSDLRYALETQVLLYKYENNVEIIYDASMNYNIGTKRNKLLELAKGDYIVFADDDDSVSGNYINEIMNATRSGCDCIGISGTITFNGTNRRQWHISKKYKRWHELNSIYYRTPNHISPVRRELALQAGFPEIAFGEDYEYSRRLFPLLKTEVVIPGDLYEYRYVQK